MRRSDREIKDFDEMTGVLERCTVCRLAFNDTDYPYIVPLNFGMIVKSGKVTLYFHCAKEGKKLDLIRKDNRVTFEADCGHTLVTDEENGSCTMNYESVMGRGRAEFVPEGEKYEALKLLMSHYHKESFSFNEDVIPQTEVFKVTVSDMSGKRRKKVV